MYSVSVHRKQNRYIENKYPSNASKFQIKITNFILKTTFNNNSKIYENNDFSRNSF